jgi:hypothetical protein
MAKRAAGQKAARRASKAGHQKRAPKERGSASVEHRLDAIERSLESVLRKLFLADHELPYPYRLTANRFGSLSQNEEDGITLAIFKEAGVSNSRFVEIACGDNGGNSGFLARELGWSGLMVDQNPEMVAIARARFNAERVKVVEAWVTRETVNDLLEEHGATGEIDLLSIDIDGNDYWLWEAIEVCSPRLVIIECNLYFGPERAVAIPYDPGFDRHQHSRMYCGASLGAMARLADRKDYRLVAMEPYGPNAYFLREDVGSTIPAAQPREVFHPRQGAVESPRSAKERARQVARESEALYAYIEEHQLPLVEFTDD